jgi:hypothetical protein
VLLTSADKEATSGLEALVRRYSGFAVVVGKAGADAVSRLCPAGTAILDLEGLKTRGWFDVSSLSLGGRGLAPAAYRVEWAEKTVLFSGRIPVKPSVPGMEELIREVTGPGGSLPAYRQALDQLENVDPALWLPAVPVHGQNANLYDRDWAKVIEQNRQAL